MFSSQGHRRRFVCGAIIFAIALAGTSIAAPPQPSGGTDGKVSALLAQIERHAAQFRRSLGHTPNQEWIVRWDSGRDIGGFVGRFADATRRLRTQFDRGQVVTDRVDDVLRRGVSIDSFMERDRSPDQAARDWALVRRDLDALALAFAVPWNRATPRFTSAQPAAASSL
jgi:hypothetical protein